MQGMPAFTKKPHAKIFIPEKEHPELNFIGTPPLTPAMLGLLPVFTSVFPILSMVVRPDHGGHAIM